MKTIWWVQLILGICKCQAVEGGKGDPYVSDLAIEYHYGRTIRK